jgi:transcription elongation factor GreB
VSKAFTKDDAADDPVVVPLRPPLPSGVVNYVTPRGLEALRAEQERRNADRAILEATPVDAERTRALAISRAQLREIDERIASAVVVDPRSQPKDEVRFGARVTVRGETGEGRRYESVGIDEADAAHGRVAFVAPIARALLGKSVGDVAVLRTPRGNEELEVVAITYDDDE